uniref:Cleavage and polyadenylation specificity factor subunit 4 n=1 Tax=Crocodylus porosus TaxID=8502 RepID=A0A7M4FKT4_CROPO
MQELVARVEKLTFKLEMDVMQQRGALPLPFPGMDKSGAAVCEFFLHGLCGKGLMCPFRHAHGEKSVVCKHWLRGLCKKGDHCEFLHEYDVTKMPECYFYSKFGECSNKECPFLHLDSASRAKDCPWYDEGFCKHGPLCRYKHTRRVVCTNYLAGFCPNGPRCKFVQYVSRRQPRRLASLSRAAPLWHRPPPRPVHAGWVRAALSLGSRLAWTIASAAAASPPVCPLLQPELVRAPCQPPDAWTRACRHVAVCKE